MSERDKDQAHGCVISLIIFGLIVLLALTDYRLDSLKRDVQEIRKHLNIPAEPEKEEVK